MTGEVYYAGMDVHKKNIAICVKTAEGKIVSKSMIPATRKDLACWIKSVDHPFIVGMEATLFTAWIYDFLRPYAKQVKVAHPMRLKAICSAKKKNDDVDAETLADLQRANLFPECYMQPPEVRNLRRVLRYRNFVVRSGVRFKNKTAGVLMECGVIYTKKKLHQKRYFKDLMANLQEVPESVKEMLSFNRNMIDIFSYYQKRLVEGLKRHPHIQERVNRLMTISGVGEITALTWVLEIGDPHRFPSIRKAVSYCGLCSAEKSSGGKSYRGPISKQRNEHLQWTLIEAAKLAPRFNEKLAEVYCREEAKGNKNRATLAVARKLVSYLMAVDKNETVFKM